MVCIWDLPTRLFHWLFAAACTAAWLSGNDARYTDLHSYAGYLALGLVLFRLVWGMVGGRYARFNQFVKGPAAIVEHLKQLFKAERSSEAGHNPAGALAILVMLTLVVMLGVSGLTVLGGEEGAGPLAGRFSIEQGVWVHAWHDVLAWMLLAVVALHLVGVALESRLQQQNLPRSMINGLKQAAEHEAERQNFAAVGWALLLVIALYTTYWFLPYLKANQNQPYLPFEGAELNQNAAWQESCSECHMAYHPSLLPQRSWQRMLDEQEDHFGEDLFLTPEMVTFLREYVRGNSAEQTPREASWRTLRSLGGGEPPLRITDTPYWIRVHRNIDEAVWDSPAVNGKLNCAACHRDAKTGGFMNGAMRLPQ